MTGGGGSQPSQQTVTQVQQIPTWEQQYAENNLTTAQSLASSPYPNYQGQIIAPTNEWENAGYRTALQDANSFGPFMGAASATAQQGTQQEVDPGQALNIPGQVNVSNPNAAYSMLTPTINPNAAYESIGGPQAWNSATASEFMSPYATAALAPQIQQLQNQFGLQNRQIDANATSAGAFGGGRQGVLEANNNFNEDLALNDLVSQGLNSAYTTGQNAWANQNNASLNAFGQAVQGGQNQEGLNLQAFNANQNAYATQEQARLNAFNTALQGSQNEQNLQLNAAQTFGQLGGEEQQYGQNAANMIYGVGQSQQQQQQSELNAAYQQYENQVNWPFQMLNVEESALANNPYSITNYTTLPGANGGASNLGAFASLAGLLGGGNKAPMGGTAI